MHRICYKRIGLKKRRSTSGLTYWGLVTQIYVSELAIFITMTS